MELSILHTLSTLEDYETYIKFVPRHLVSKETFTIMTDMREWYKTNTEMDWTTFGSWFKMVRHASMKVEQLELYSAIFKKMDGFTPTGSDLETVHALIGRDYAAKISEVAGDVADGASTDLTTVDNLMEDWRRDTDNALKSADLYVTKDIHEIMEAVLPTGGKKWRLAELNLSLGPLRKGDFITVGARPDSGKTSLLASEVTFIAEQLIKDDKIVLWFCNEEMGKRVKFRIMQAALGVSVKHFFDNYEVCHANYEAQLSGDRIELVHQNMMTIQTVQQELRVWGDKVGLIVIDQLHKMQGMGSHGTNDVSRQAMLFQWARGLAEQAPVLNVHQLKGQAEGEMFPSMDMLYGSTTLIQGECDAILMLGRSHDETLYAANARGLYCPKNKLIGDLKSGGKFRNNRFEVKFNNDTSRFKGAY